MLAEQMAAEIKQLTMHVGALFSQVNAQDRALTQLQLDGVTFAATVNIDEEKFTDFVEKEQAEMKANVEAELGTVVQHARVEFQIIHKEMVTLTAELKRLHQSTADEFLKIQQRMSILEANMSNANNNTNDYGKTAAVYMPFKNVPNTLTDKDEE